MPCGATWTGDRPRPRMKPWMQHEYDNPIHHEAQHTEFIQFHKSLSPDEKSKLLKAIGDGKTDIVL